MQTTTLDNQTVRRRNGPPRQRPVSVSTRILGFAALALIVLIAASCASMARDGRRLLRDGRYDGAIERFTRHLAEQPDDWKVREQLAYANLKGGDYPEAVREFQTVLNQRPDASDAALYLGLALLRSGQLEAGIDVWRDFLSKGPSGQVREVRRLLTLLEIAESRRFAVAAVGSPDGGMELDGSRSDFAVIYYNDLSAEKGLGAVQKSLAAMIISDLGRVEGLQVVNRFRMDALLEEMVFRQSGLVDEGQVREAGRMLAGEYLIYGTLSTLLKDLRVNTTIYRTGSEPMVESFLYSDPLDNFYELQKKIVFSVLERSQHPVSDAQKKRIADPHTDDFNAFLHFGQGLDALDAGEWETARYFFERAVDEDSGFRLAREALQACPAGAGIDFGLVERMGLDPRANALVTDRLERVVERMAPLVD
ncbi:MAG: tetratricopeptide repeat protein [Desulfobacterales bacterium]